ADHQCHAQGADDVSTEVLIGMALLHHRSIATKARKHESLNGLVSCFRVFVASTMTVWISLSAGSSAAQQKTPPPVFRSGTRLVVETVTVKDKNGNVVEGLTAKDFTLTEDGESQTISFVEFQRVQPTP